MFFLIITFSFSLSSFSLSVSLLLFICVPVLPSSSSALRLSHSYPHVPFLPFIRFHSLLCASLTCLCFMSWSLPGFHCFWSFWTLNALNFLNFLNFLLNILILIISRWIIWHQLCSWEALFSFYSLTLRALASANCVITESMSSVFVISCSIEMTARADRRSWDIVDLR